MNANPMEAMSGGLPASTNEPVYFSVGDHNLFGWLHRPAAPQADVGLVICKPFGYEALCAHSSVRAFADAAAELGVPALRFDYVSTGDSPDIGPQADQIDVWIRDVVAAAAELRRSTGVQRVCLLGIRLGALLAARAARECAGIAGLFLVAPVINGKRYLRELRTTRLAALMGTPSEAAESRVTGDLEAAYPGLMEFTGYPLSAASIATLARIELCEADLPSGIELFIVDRTDLPGAQEFSDSLARTGVHTRHVALPGFVEMALVAPQFAVVPQAIVQALRDFLRRMGARSASPGGESRRVAPTVLRGAASTALSLQGESVVSERPVCFGTDVQIFGIVTEPHSESRRRRAVILLNAGTDYHMGASRMYVTLGRAWAGSGYYVLRMDFAGIGDSGTRSGQPDDEMFPAAALDDIRAAVNFMRERYGIQEVNLCGLCSGAYHALRAAAAGLAVHRILMVNPQNFFWKKGALIEGLQIAEVVRNPGVYSRRVVSLGAWKRLFSGKVDLWRIARIYAIRPFLSLESMVRNIAHYLRIRLPHDLGWELEDIARRGTKIVFVFSKGEAGISLLKLQSGLSLKRLGARCVVHIIEDADHTFSRSATRSTMERTLTQELLAWPAVPAVVDTAKHANAL